MNATFLSTNRLWAYLQMMRPANIVTAWADILAGFAASGAVALLNIQVLGWLLLATTGLYGGGIVLNDVFDAELDAQERPERPIPSGRASRQGATLLGSALLVTGVVAAAQVSLLSATLACGIALAATLYDAVGKHHPILGPVNMVTTISRGEVHGAKNITGIIALLLIGLVIAGLLSLGLLQDYQVLAALPFVALFAVRVLLPFIKAVREPKPEQIRIAVKAGVLSLIVLDATVAAGFASLPYGLLVLSLLPISMALAQIFAVT